MSFKAIEVEGDVTSVTEVQETKGKFSEVTLQCGEETVTIVGKIKKIMREGGTSSVSAVEITEPGKASFQVNSLNSPELKNADGTERVEVPGTTYKPVPGGKAHQTEDPEGDNPELERVEDEPVLDAPLVEEPALD
jgi:hypothetical protein